MVYRRRPFRRYAKNARGKGRRTFRYRRGGTTRKKKTQGPPVDKVVTKTFAFVCRSDTTADDGLGLIRNSKNTGITSNFCWNTARVPGLAAYASVYSEYRVDGITLDFIPTAATLQVEDSDTGTSASNISKATPLIYVGRWYGNEPAAETTFSSEDAALLEGAKCYKMTSRFGMKFVPNAVGAVTSTTRTSFDTELINPAYIKQYKKWYTFFPYGTLLTNNFPNFYGVKYCTTTTTSDNAEFCYKVVARLKMSFKGLQGRASSTGNIAATAGTVFAGVA